MMARLRTLLSRFGRRPAPREIILPPFHPIIFANGRDDDTEGLKAFIEARPVIHAGRLIIEGNCILSGLTLRLRCNAMVVNLPSGKQLMIGGNCPPFEVIHARHGWTRQIVNSEIRWNQKVEP